MPLTQVREISAASRLENVRYAIRDLACVADEVEAWYLLECLTGEVTV